jgi:hypothetical protein
MAATDLRADGIGIAKGDGWLFVALVLGIVLIGEGLKLFRAPALLPVIVVAAIYARESILRRQHLPLLLFSVLGLVYVVLSYVQAFPSAWTRYYDASVILQQASYLAVLLPLVAASQKWWDDSRFDPNREVILFTIALAAFVVGTGVDMLLPGVDDARPFVTLRNYIFIGLLALSYLAFRSTKWRSIAILALVILAVLAFWRGQFLQNTIAYIILLGFLAIAILRIPADRLILCLLLLLLAGITIVGLRDPLPVFELDNNTGWRLAWWNDAITATTQTGGLGVGFGTEALRNEYTALLQRDQYRQEGGDFLLISTHSAFFDTLFRTGAAGFLLLCVVLWRCFPHAHMSLPARAHCCALFVILILCLHSNLGLQSPMYALGVAFCIGYLQSERRKAQDETIIQSDDVSTSKPIFPARIHRY